METSAHEFDIGVDGQAVSFSHSELQALRHTADGSAPAVYVLRDQVSILYVGESPNGLVRPMTGLKIGYAQSSAYRWRRDADLRNTRIECLVFGLEPDFKNCRERRALEAEIAVAIRWRTGAWPRKMTEIHFSELLRHGASVVDAQKLIIGELVRRAWIPDSELSQRLTNG